MKIPAPTEGGNFTPTPEGQYTAICGRVVDLGTQKSDGQYGVKYNRKVLLGWEIPEVRIEQDGKDQPALHQERYTWSMHEKANLRKMLESWRGVTFKEADFGVFDVANLIGVPAMMQIAHSVGGNGKTYANIQSIMRSPIKKSDWPSLEGDSIYLSLDEFDQGEFDKLSEYWQGLIADSPEFKTLKGTVVNTSGPMDGGGVVDDGLEDLIPF